MRALVPDFDATIEIDPALSKINLEIKKFESIDMDDDDKNAALKNIVDDLKETKEEYEALDDSEKVKVEIGFIPPAIRTRFKNLSLKFSGEKDLTEKSEQFAEACRMIVRHGMKGWSAPDKFDVEQKTIVGITYDLAGPLAMRAIERHDWIDAIAAEVLKYNELTDEEKKRSL